MKWQSAATMIVMAGALTWCGFAQSADPAKGEGGKTRRGAAQGGKVDPQDVARARKRGGVPGDGKNGRRPTAEDFIRLYDKNGNGKLDPDEAAVAKAARKGLEERQGGAAGGLVPAGGQGGANGGEAPPVDKKAAKKKKKNDLLEKYDANGDGKLDAEERKAIKADKDAQREAEREAKKNNKKKKPRP